MKKIQLNKQHHPDGSITYSYTFKPNKEKSFLEQEEDIAEITAKVGGAITEQLLESYDTQGEPLQVQGERMTAKGRQKKLTSRPTEKSK